MADAPTVSIVIPTRSRRALLAETIDSILSQTLPNWELIVVDDASEDDTFSYVSGLGDERIRVVRLEQHAERSAARNTGLDLARGEFILFLDDDDLLIESGLQTHLDAFVSHPAAIASVGNHVVQFDGSGARVLRSFVRRRQERNLWQDVLFGWSATCGQCLFRTSAMKSVHGWNTALNTFEDHELWLRLSRLGPAVLSPDAVYRYRVHGGQWRPPKTEMQALLTTIREHAVQQLHGSERKRSEQILAAREQFRLAMRLYRGGNPFSALISFLKVVRLFPGILGSPIMGPKLRRRMMRCLVGGKSKHMGDAGPTARQSDDDD